MNDSVKGKAVVYYTDEDTALIAPLWTELQRVLRRVVTIPEVVTSRSHFSLYATQIRMGTSMIGEPASLGR